MTLIFILLILSQTAAFSFLYWDQSRQFQNTLNIALLHIRAKDNDEVVRIEQTRKQYDVQLQYMKDTIAKGEAAPVQKVRDEVSGTNDLEIF
jgi:predicted nucleic acid-binding Zn ribbon protein